MLWHDPGESVVLLDPRTDLPIGTAEKLAAHRQGLYHSAISVLLFDGDGRQILQRRARSKYHCPGMWSNACCSHPRPGEAAHAAAERRLGEELGVHCPLLALGTVRYRSGVPVAGEGEAGLIEHERVSLFGGIYTGAFSPDPHEVESVTLMRFDQNSAELLAEATPWFKLYVQLFGTELLDQVTTKQATPERDFGFFDCDANPIR